MLRFWPMYLLISMVLGIFACWFWGLRINVSPSMPLGIYRIHTTAPQRGNLAMFCLPGAWATLAHERAYLAEGSCPTGQRPLVKRIVGIAGDIVELSPAGIHINGKLLPESQIRTTDSQGRSISSALKAGSIPTGHALLLGDGLSSFDSRYFGVVPHQSLHKVSIIQQL